MKKSYPLKICPWCNTTPKFFMDCEMKTWLIKIGCQNYLCPVQPKTQHIAIRKKQRESEDKIESKVQRIVDRWNSANLDFKKEGFTLDFTSIVKSFLEDKLGLPGHRQDNSKEKREDIEK